MGALRCDGCTACCRNQLVVLVEEDGDPSNYQTVPLEIDGAGPDESIRCLENNIDGACVYLGPGGCTIYDRRPAMCRVFDCRLAVADALRRRLPVESAVLAAGLQRMGTLDP